MKKQKQLTLEDVQREVDKNVGHADVQRGDKLERLQTVRNAKATGLRREHERLARKLGANHPRVLGLAVKMETNRLLLRDLTVETARARTETPVADEGTWVLHGYVRDQELKPVAHLTVALYDQRSRWVERLGFACTREDGYFRLDACDLDDTSAPVFIHVLNSQASHLYADTAPFTPTGGRVDSREIVLPENAQACTPPVLSRNDPIPEAGAWVIKGRVTDEQGRGMGGLVVRLYDKDLFFDDRLGEAETDANGYYSLTYHTEDFRDFIERKPDLYLTVLDQEGETLYTSKRRVRYESGRVEVIDVKLGR